MSKIMTRVETPEYREGWERVFGAKEVKCIGSKRVLTECSMELIVDDLEEQEDEA